MSSMKRDNFISTILICMSFNSFPCLNGLARTSSTILNTRDKSRHPCLIHDLRGKFFQYFTFKSMENTGLSFSFVFGWFGIRIIPTL